MRAQIDRILRTVLVVLMIAMTLNVLWQVFTRFLLGAPSAFTDELARFLLIWVGLLGATYVSGKQLHVSINLLVSRMGTASTQLIGKGISVLVCVFVVLVFVIGGCRLVYITFVLGQNSAALQIPLAYVYTVVPISGLLIVYYELSQLGKR